VINFICTVKSNHEYVKLIIIFTATTGKGGRLVLFITLHYIFSDYKEASVVYISCCL